MKVSDVFWSGIFPFHSVIEQFNGNIQSKFPCSKPSSYREPIMMLTTTTKKSQFLSCWHCKVDNFNPILAVRHTHTHTEEEFTYKKWFNFHWVWFLGLVFFNICIFVILSFFYHGYYYFMRVHSTCIYIYI